MYSVVLMVALTGGGDVPAGLFNHGCCGGGCHGCFGGCHGCCGGGGFGGCHGCHGGGHRRGHGCCGGGGFGGCHGCHGGGHHRGHGCCGGCYGGCMGMGYGCCGGGYGGGFGCCGGGYGGGCYGGGYGGCVGGACFGGCVGGVGGVGGIGGIGGVGGIGGGVIGAPSYPGNIVPGNVAPANQAKPTDGKKSTMENAAPATIVVTVPADARLTIDDEATTSTSTRRVFVSPALEAGREYHYTLKAEFVKDGKPVTVSKEVAVQAGNETRVTLDAGSLAGVASR